MDFSENVEFNIILLKDLHGDDSLRYTNVNIHFFFHKSNPTMTHHVKQKRGYVAVEILQVWETDLLSKVPSELK